jgi:hypothetical protein
MTIQSWSQLNADSDAASRLTLGQALLTLKHQNVHRNMGYVYFSTFLDAGVVPFKHTTLRQAIRLAERTELHSVLHLGIGRLNELMRLNPERTLQLLQDGTPSGPVSKLSVRKLRRIVEAMLQEDGCIGHHEPSRLKELLAQIEALELDQQREIVHLLIQKHAPESSNPEQLLHPPTVSTPALEAYLPDTRSGHPRRWQALTEHLEMLNAVASQEQISFQPQLQGLNKPLAECEKAVVYLDRLFRSLKEQKRCNLSLSRVLTRILTGRDHDFNARKLQILRLLATSRQPSAMKVSVFWEKLANQVCPPLVYQNFLNCLACAVQQQTWSFRCNSPYQAEFLLHCLQDPVAEVFWQTACAVLDVHSLRIAWQEGRVTQEKVIALKGRLAGVA